MSTTRPISPADLWRLPRVGSPVPLPGGGGVVVTVTTFDVAANRGSGQLWLAQPDHKSRPLTPPELDAAKPTVRGSQLAFIASAGDEKKKQVYLIDVTEESPTPNLLTSLPLGVLGSRWTPHGSALIVLAYVLKGHLTLEATAAELSRRAEEKFTVHVSEDATFRYWDTWLTTGEVPHLFRLEPASGQLEDLTPTSVRWWSWPNTDDPWDDFDISPDGTRLAYSADASSPPHRQLRHSVFELDLATGAEKELTPDATSHSRRPRYSPDGSEIAFGQQLVPGFYGDRVRLVIHNRQSGLQRILTETWDHSADSWTFDPRGRLIFLAENGGRTGLFRLGEDDIQPSLLTTGGTLGSPVVDEEGIVSFAHHSFGEAPEIATLGDDGSIEPYTSFARPLLEGIEWGEVEDVVFTGADQAPVQMFLLHPPHPESGPAPLVHLIHGGPHGITADGWQWRWHAHTFAAAGYLVAMVNFHGSTSFGQAFTASIQGAWGDKPYRDIEAATDLLIGRGLVDETRMAVAGGSYGGYLAAFVTSQTGRYTCAIVHAGVTNFGGMYASDLTSGRPLAYGAEIFEDRATVERYSPSSQSAGYSTPTLVIHGERDYRVPATQGLEIYGVLKAKGVPAKLVYYPDENHWILSPQASLHWYDQVLQWLNLYLN
ncbi:MAG: S9 family peptidase [Actinomycetota bacterium]